MSLFGIQDNKLIVGLGLISGGWYNYRAGVGVEGFSEVVNLNDVADLNGMPYLTGALSANDRDLIVGIGMYNPGALTLHGVLLRSNE
jgi:hypothetical protein